MTVDAKTLKRNRAIVVFIFLLPVIVIAAASFVYYTGIGKPHGTSNKGHLIKPPRRIDSISIATAAGKRFDYAAQKPKWTLLIPGDAACNQACRHALWLTRQVHIAIGRKADHVRRYYLSDERPLSPSLSDLISREHTRLQILYTTPAALRKLLSVDSIDPLRGDVFYLVDPHGWVMMYYTGANSGADVISDLKFLLSQSGVD